MAEVTGTKALLLMALRDLLDGEEAMAERLPGIRANASDPALADCIGSDISASARQRDLLADVMEALGEKAEGERNIWLRAILDDADNDAETIASGVLLDIALTGALRKAKQSERVSYETAIALAQRLGHESHAATLSRIRDEEAACDERLAELLGALGERAPGG